MGGTFSAGQDNDELVDNLVDSGYIRTKKIEQVFRAVDRGDYFLSFHREDAYKDFAWKHGNIHLSAPCIYCEVMEELSLQPGLSFLNLGSGTGYLSTMAGLLLTQSGVNHGIELHEDCLKYAYDRLEEFKQKSLALDEFDFCEPIFVQGNCLSVVQGRRYDRVYCGAACPESQEALIKEFVKVGGILVMPFKDNLVRAKRVNENTWEHKNILQVSFANLVIPTSNDAACHLPECDPLPLQELCREKIRRRLRQNIWREHTDLEICKPISLDRNRSSSTHRALRQFIIPIFDESDDETLSDEDEESRVRRTQLLLNVDSPPGENLRTNLQLMRAVIQPNRRSNNAAAAVTAAMVAAAAAAAANDETNERREPEVRPRTPSSPDDYIAAGQLIIVDEQADIGWPVLEDEESPSTEDTNFSSEHERQDSESSSEWACGNSESQHHERDSDNKNEDRPPTSGLSAYSNMSESESESEAENESEMETERRSTLVDQRYKASRKETADSGILEDACVTGNDDASLSSDSEFANGTPVKHKRCSSSGNSSCSSAGSQNNNHANASSNNGGNNNNNNDGSEPRRKRSPNRIGVRERESAKPGHYIDTNAFNSYMKEKIHQLPLPYSLKLYINYNRTL